jgi:hypothetical protein
VVGYPPCPRISSFKKFIKEKFGLETVVGTHPIPQNYYDTHSKLATWNSEVWQETIKDVICDEEMRKAYD